MRSATSYCGGDDMSQSRHDQIVAQAHKVVAALAMDDGEHLEKQLQDLRVALDPKSDFSRMSSGIIARAVGWLRSRAQSLRAAADRADAVAQALETALVEARASRRLLTRWVLDGHYPVPADSPAGRSLAKYYEEG